MERLSWLGGAGMRHGRWILLAALAVVMVAGCRSSTRTGGSAPPGEPRYFAYTFEECLYDTDCFEYPDDLCYEVYNSGVTTGMCTFDCRDDYDCLVDSVCEDIDGPWICYEECWDDWDCAPGFACFYDDVGGVDVCLAY